MNCPHCKNPLPQGLTVCYRCGKYLNTPVKPIPVNTTSVPAIKGKRRALLLVIPPLAALAAGFALILLLSGGLSGIGFSSGSVPAGVLLPAAADSLPQMLPIGEMMAGSGTTPLIPENPQGADPITDTMEPDHSPGEEIDVPPYPDVAEEQPRSITLNRDLLGMIGRTNEELIYMNGDDCVSMMMDGGPMVSYYEKPVLYPLDFFLESDMNDIWNTWDSAPGSENGYVERNIWLRSARVDAFMLNEGNAGSLFEINGAITYEALAELFSHTEGLVVIAQEDQYEQWPFDIYTCEFLFDGYGIFATFRQVGRDDFILAQAVVYSK